MKETVVFVPGASGVELLRSLARFGRNTLGMRIVGSVELARFALLRSGITITNVFLPRKDEPSVTDSFLREIPYFENASFSDAESMAAAFYPVLIVGSYTADSSCQAIPSSSQCRRTVNISNDFFVRPIIF